MNKLRSIVKLLYLPRLRNALLTRLALRVFEIKIFPLSPSVFPPYNLQPPLNNKYNTPFEPSFQSILINHHILLHRLRSSTSISSPFSVSRSPELLKTQLALSTVSRVSWSSFGRDCYLMASSHVNTYPPVQRLQLRLEPRSTVSHGTARAGRENGVRRVV